MKPNLHHVSVYFGDASYRPVDKAKQCFDDLKVIMKHAAVFEEQNETSDQQYDVHIALSIYEDQDCMSFRFYKKDEEKPFPRSSKAYQKALKGLTRFDVPVSQTFGSEDYSSYMLAKLAQHDHVRSISDEDNLFREIAEARGLLAIKLESEMNRHGLFTVNLGDSFELGNCLVDIYGDYRVDLFFKQVDNEKRDLNP